MKTMIDKIVLIYIKNRKILSSRSKGKDTYYLPGGKREGDESDVQSLIREIREELSVDIIPESINYYGTFRAQAHGAGKGVIVQMTCYTAEFTGTPQPSNEIEELRWFGAEGYEVSSPVDKIIYNELKLKDLID